VTNPGGCPQQRILDKLDEMATDITDLKVSVAKLETRLESAPKSSLTRDGGITVSGGAVGAALLALLQHFVK
jgi:hypothetical protein